MKRFRNGTSYTRPSRQRRSSPHNPSPYMYTQTGTHKLFFSQRKFQQLHAHLEHALNLVSESPACMTFIFQTAASLLGLAGSQFFHASFKSRVLISYRPLTHPQVRVSHFQSQLLRDSSSQCKSSKLGSPTQDLEPLVFRENLQGCNIPPTDGLQHCGYGSWPYHVSVAFLFYLQWWTISSLCLHVILRGSFSICSCNFGLCPWEEASPRTLYSTILSHPSCWFLNQQLLKMKNLSIL